MARSERVVIVGGGLIGLCVAHVLQREGHRVTVVEREHLGAGAATGNAGELTPQQVTPLASFKMLKDIATGVFSKSSYLSIRASQLLKLGGFGLDFLRASTRSRSKSGTQALAQFSAAILPALQRFKRDGIDISGGGFGYLMTSSDHAELHAAHRGFSERARLGLGEAPGPVLTGDPLRDQEPVLGSSISGGFMLPGEFSLDPETFVASLIHTLHTAGVEFHVGLEAVRLGKQGGVVCRAEDGREVIVNGDRVVVAAGARTTAILANSGIRSRRIVPGKGYSFTVPVDVLPRHLVHSMDRHCLAIPMNGRLRIVGLMDFAGDAPGPDAARLDVLTRAARGLVSGANWEARTDEWVGDRPMTANGLPLLDVVPQRRDVIVASGHNMHGLSLGPITAEIVSDMIAGRETIVDSRRLDLRPFALS